ncbi:MAG: sialidase family protein [Gaiellaceae bacterium]
MTKLLAALAPLVAAAIAVAPASAGGGLWKTSVQVVNQVASSATSGGGYPVPAGATRPDAGTCRPGTYDSNRSESWLAVQPGTENLVGASKLFFERWSTFYDFHLGAYSIPNGTPAGTVQIPGYDCVSTGTQAMPPSWTNDTDPNVDFDTQGRAYQATLPFNAYWAGGMHPNGAIGVVYSDDLGRTWTAANGGAYLDMLSNSNSITFGHVEDKQWIAVNHFLTSRYADHVYAMWTTFNGAAGNGKINVAVSRDRGQTFSKPAVLTEPKYTSPANTYVYPSVGPDGTVYVAFVGGFDTTNKNRVGSVYVTKSTDDGVTWTPFTRAASPVENPNGYFANTRFRDGIIENFAASPDYPGHVYLTYEDWDPAAGTSNVEFTQSTDGGLTWSAPVQVNDDADTAASDQFQPSVAAGSGGAVAVAFYDRRGTCPSDPSVLPADVGRANFCVDVSLQAFRDSGSGAVPVGANVRVSKYAWDPEQPGQTIGGLSQYPCAAHTDPCPQGGGFIGDYFGLAVSAGNVYALSVSTHYPEPGVSADDGGRVYDQQQVLATVARSALGIQ